MVEDFATAAQTHLRKNQTSVFINPFFTYTILKINDRKYTNLYILLQRKNPAPSLLH